MRRASSLLLVALVAGCNTEKVVHLPPTISVAPSSVNFHVVTLGQSAQEPVTIQSETTTPVEVSSLSLSGPDAAAFATSASPGSVSSEATVTVTFTPSEARTFNAILTVASNDAAHPSITVALTGVGAEEQVEVSVEVIDGGLGTAPRDGGLSIDFGLDTWGAGSPGWPNLLLENVGGAPATLTGYAFSDAGGAFFFPEAPTVPQAIASQQTRVLPIAFAPPSGSTATSFTGSVTLQFDDPRLPSATIQLSGQATPTPPPQVCSGITSVQELDGSIAVPTAFGAVVAIEPGAHVDLSAYSDDLGDAGPSPCTFDPGHSRSSLTYQWTLSEAPPGSVASLSTPTDPHTVLVPDLPGHYVVSLAVVDPSGTAGVPAYAGATQVSFDAAPLEDLTVRAAWPGFQGVDLDLHFVRPGSQPFDPVGDVCALNAGTTHNWGNQGTPTDDPHFSGDDQGNGQLAESAWLNDPGDSCLPDGGCRFGLWVHYYQDNRSLTGAPACTLAGCVEGQACGCPSSDACEPNPGAAGACGVEVAPQAEVYFKGDIAPALQVPIPLASFDLPSPCFMWHAADVEWTPDGGLALELLDGGAELESYWGSHTDETRQCAEGDGGWESRAPPTYP